MTTYSINSLNVAPIRQILERWISKYEAYWANTLLRVKESAEREAITVTAAAREEQASKVDETEIVKGAHIKAEETNQGALQEAQEIVQDAQRRAYHIVEEAESVASMRREGADQYAREVLFNLEEQLAEVLGQVRRGIDALRLEASAQPVENHVPA